MELITRIYQICGLNFTEPTFFSICRLTRQFLVRLVFLLHLTYFVVNMKLQYNFHLSLFQHPDFFGNITVLTEMNLPLVSHAAIVFESFIKRRKEQKMERLMRKIYINLNCESHAEITNLPLLKFLCLLVVNSFIFITVLIMVSDIVGKCFPPYGAAT